MNKADFLIFVTASAKRAVQILHLSNQASKNKIFLCSPSIGKELTLREPEIGLAFAQQAEAQEEIYGIEWPTEEKYKLSGKDLTPPRRALTDFALLKTESGTTRADVLIEFKTLQNDTMKKDFIKLIREKSGTGRCMFHVLHGATSVSISSVEEKYNRACEAAMRDTQTDNRQITSQDDDTPWYTLFVMVLYHRGKDWSGGRCRLYGYKWDVNQNIWLRESDTELH